MRKKLKNESTSDATSAAAPEAVASAPEAASQTKKVNPASKAKSSNKARAKTSSLKKTSGKTAAAKRAARKAKSSEPSDADIRLRAYFIAEQRVQFALQGDPARDWLDAKQQLLAEAGAAR